MYDYVETGDDNDDEIDTNPNNNGMRCFRLVTLYDMQEDTVNLFSSEPTGGFRLKRFYSKWHKIN